jgi:hypothetical protein
MNGIADIFDAGDLPDLGPKRRLNTFPPGEIEKDIEKLSRAAELPEPRLPLLKAALLLWNDHLDEAHAIVQDMNTPDAAMLHAIIHRREPDYFNSKYWWRRVGQHPSFELLAKRVSELLERQASPLRRDEFHESHKHLKAALLPRNQWDPFAFVDAVESALSTNAGEEIKILKEIQKVEMEAFLKTLSETE